MICLCGTIPCGRIRLVMTGHMHAQYILEKDGLWEILSGMPFSGAHLVGNLAVGPDRAVYYAEPLDLENRDDAAARKLKKLDRESSDAMNEVFSALLDRQNLHGTKKRRIMKLIRLYFQYYNTGSLADHAKELQKDPYYSPMIQALWEYNYGPWMKDMIETTEHSARELELDLQDLP